MTKRRKSPSAVQLDVLAQMRAAKERKRLARIAAGWTPEPLPKQFLRRHTI